MAHGSPMFAPVHPVLARDCVRYVGEPVALVVAETLNQAANEIGQQVIRDDIFGTDRVAANAAMSDLDRKWIVLISIPRIGAEMPPHRAQPWDRAPAAYRLIEPPHSFA
jgi:hypothetical protein